MLENVLEKLAPRYNRTILPPSRVQHQPNAIESGQTGEAPGLNVRRCEGTTKGPPTKEEALVATSCSESLDGVQRIDAIDVQLD